MTQKRQLELDLLRLFALLSVISAHCLGMGGANDIPVNDPARQILIFFDSIATWQVPIYVMISGRFFLDPARGVSKTKIIKSIKRIVIAFVFWNTIYQVFYILSNSYSGLNWKGITTQAVLGPYHFWYLFMIVGMYAITPFLRKITEDKKLMEYFIIVFFVFQCLEGYGEYIPIVGDIIVNLLRKTNFHFAIGYSGYYILGFYLNKFKISEKKELFLYVSALALVVITSYATIHRSVLEGINTEFYIGYLKPNIIIVASAIYTFFVKRVSKIDFGLRLSYWISKLSEYSFGVYLIHALIIELLGYIGFSPVIITPFIMQPLVVMISFIITNIVVWMIRGIPVIGKKIT